MRCVYLDLRCLSAQVVRLTALCKPPVVAMGDGVDRAMLERHIAQAEEHVALGEHHTARQRELLGKLERGGHDTLEARRLLANFEEAQELHLAGRDRVRQKLSQNSCRPCENS